MLQLPMSPKELLAAESKASNRIPLDNASLDEGATLEGKEGWLLREVDPELRASELHVKVWVSVYQSRLLFSDAVSASAGSSTFSLFESSSRNRSLAELGLAAGAGRGTCFGYLDLTPGRSEVRVSVADTASFSPSSQSRQQSHAQGRHNYFSFQVRDGAHLSVTFAAEKESERDEWVALLRKAIAGSSQTLPLPTLSIPAAAEAATPEPAALSPPNDIGLDSSQQTTHVISSSSGSMKLGVGGSTKNSSLERSLVLTETGMGAGIAAIDFPHKEGFLRKSSTGPGNGGSVSHVGGLLRTTKRRWFRLAGGELRYYEDQDALSRGRLKDTLSLRGAHLKDASGGSGGGGGLADGEACVITVHLLSGRTLRLEAPTAKVAAEWRNAFAETLALLPPPPDGVAGTSIDESSSTVLSARSLSEGMGSTERFAVRRQNIHDRFDPAAPVSIGAASLAKFDVAGSRRSTSMDSGDASGALHGSNGLMRARSATVSAADGLGGSGSRSAEADLASSPRARSLLRSTSQSMGSPGSRVGEAVGSIGSKHKQHHLALLQAHQQGAPPPHASPMGSPFGGSSSAKSFSLLAGESSSPLNNPAGAGGTGSALGATNKSMATMEMLRGCLQQNFLLRTLADLTPLIDSMRERVCVPGEIVIWQGSSGDVFYVLESGQCDVLKNGQRVATILPGKAFGELALLNNATRQASIRACKVCHLWCLTRQQFREVAAAQEAQQLEERVRFLSEVDLFSRLLPSALEMIAQVMELRAYAEGERIVRQGDSGPHLAFYMIQSGRVVVTQSSLLKGGSSELVRLGPGKYFGELALMDNSPRKATVTATTAVKCWTLDRQSFLGLFGSMEEALNESIGVKLLQGVKLLEDLSSKQLQQVARRLISVSYVEGETIIRQGDVGDTFFMLSGGEVSVQVNHVQVATLQQGAFFGEMSLLSNERRSATVAALTDCTCLELSRADFDELLGPLDAIIKAEADRRKQEQELKASSSHRRSSAKFAAAASATEVRGRGGEVGGGSGSGFISSLRRLSDNLFTPSSSPSGSLAGRASSKGAGVVGNNDGSKQHSAWLPTHLAALFKSTNAVFDLDHIERLKRLGSGTFASVFLVRHSIQDTDKFYALKQMHKQDLLEKRQEGYVYSERDLLLLMGGSEAGQLWVPALYASLQDAKSLFLVQQFIPGGDLWTLLYCSPKLGRSKHGGVPLQQAQFYAANVVAALSHIHEEEIVYRNVKPENFVVDAAGYLKVVDFGSAKRLPLELMTHTLCGAAEYCAPEMVLARGHHRAVDLWGLGVLLFELLLRATPFQHNSLSMVYQNIVESENVLKLIFSGGMHVVSATVALSAGNDFSATSALTAAPLPAPSPSSAASSSPAPAAPTAGAASLDGNAKKLICNLLSFNPHRRLGMLHDGYRDVWKHPFFKGIKAENVEKRRATAPYIPAAEELAAMGEVDDFDIFDVIEDPDQYPAYTGAFDYSFY